MAARLWRRPSDDELKKIQADLKLLLEGVVGALSKPSPSEQLGGPNVVSFSVGVAFHLPPGEPSSIDRPMLTILATTARDAVMAIATLVLSRTAMPPIARCPGCRRYFPREGKREWCSRSCYMRSYMQKLREETGEASAG